MSDVPPAPITHLVLSAHLQDDLLVINCRPGAPTLFRRFSDIDPDRDRRFNLPSGSRFQILLTSVSHSLIDSGENVFTSSETTVSTLYSASAVLAGNRRIYWSLCDPPGDGAGNVITALDAIRELFVLATDHPSIR